MLPKGTTYWVIADTHFGHAKMVEHCFRPVDFEDRILNALSVIKPEDVLIHLGDFCFGNDEGWNRIFFDQCTATKKWLVMGNHDNKSSTWYLNHGWNWVGKSFCLDIYGKSAVFTHEPIVDPIILNIHGHLHNNLHGEWKERVEKIGTLNRLFSLEDQDYKPVNLRKLMGV